MTPATGDRTRAADGARGRTRARDGARALCWALAAFDLALGTAALLLPDIYAAVMHPRLDAPQLDLIQRMGAVWLAMAMVAARAATCGRDRRALWLTVLAVFRLVEVPADVVYASVARGAGWVAPAILWSSAAINLAAAWALRRAAGLASADPLD